MQYCGIACVFAICHADAALTWEILDNLANKLALPLLVLAQMRKLAARYSGTAWIAEFVSISGHSMKLHACPRYDL